MNRFGLICITVFLLFPGDLFGQQSAARLRADLQAGLITRHDFIVNRGYALFAPERLASRYRIPDDLPEKCGMEVVNLLLSEFGNLTAQEQSFFQQYLRRPTLDKSHISPDGLFKIHYTTTGDNRVPSEDENFNGVPDFVDEAAIAFDHAHRFYTDTLGYQEPPMDYVDGNEYDVYMTDLGDGNYGSTTAENDQTDTPWLDYSSYVKIDNDFEGEKFYSHGLDGLRVTAAHEYHHAIQFGYTFRSSDIYFYEMTAVWFEDVLYDEVNDYLQYLPILFGEDRVTMNPKINTFYLPFTQPGNLGKYGMCIWNRFLAKRHGMDIIKSMWEQMHLQSAIETMEKVINEETAIAFEDELHLFYVWNYFTGSRADTINYYDEGHLFPELVLNEVIDNPNDTTIVINNRFLSTKYIGIKQQLASTYNIDVEAQTDDEGLWRATAALSDEYNQPTLCTISFMDGGATISSFGNNQELVIISTMTAKRAQPGNYPLTIDLEFAGPPTINVNKLFPTIPSPANFTELNNVKIPFVLIEPDIVELKIYSISGVLVKSFPKISLIKGIYGKDNTPFLWDGLTDNNEIVPSGVYIYIMRGENFIERGKMAIIR